MNSVFFSWFKENTSWMFGKYITWVHSNPKQRFNLQSYHLTKKISLLEQTISVANQCVTKKIKEVKLSWVSKVRGGYRNLTKKFKKLWRKKI